MLALFIITLNNPLGETVHPIPAASDFGSLEVLALRNRKLLLGVRALFNIKLQLLGHFKLLVPSSR